MRESLSLYVYGSNHILVVKSIFVGIVQKVTSLLILFACLNYFVNRVSNSIPSFCKKVLGS